MPADPQQAAATRATVFAYGAYVKDMAPDVNPLFQWRTGSGYGGRGTEGDSDFGFREEQPGRYRPRGRAPCFMGPARFRRRSSWISWLRLLPLL